MLNQDLSDSLQEIVTGAAETRIAINISGGNSKQFYGRTRRGEALDLTQHRGIIDHQPTELVVTARAGTPILELQQALGEHNQFIPFDPPCFDSKTTLGGAIATGLSGPGRPTYGAARDVVLGVTCLNGRGEKLKFGGQVMKNVAGYDVSRLLVGSMGTLGVLLDISIKILPKPKSNQTRILEMNEQDALSMMTNLNQSALPISATAFVDNHFYVRLSGCESTVNATAKNIGGEAMQEQSTFWTDLRDHQLDFFLTDQPLWRLSVAPASASFLSNEEKLLEWNGGLRWIVSDQSPGQMQTLARKYGGHATLFRNGNADNSIFHPLSSGLEDLHRKLKHSFDPHNILNPGVMYAD